MSKIQEVPKLIRQLYGVVDTLEGLFPGRRFTLDGHLVGSIGEVLAAYYYGLKLLPASSEGHDARTREGLLVQIKATQTTSVGLRSCPQHLVVLKILASGNVKQAFNGPGRLAWENAGKMQKNGQRGISLSTLAKLMERVPQELRLPTVTAM